jgi:hypothetical protein
MAFVELSKISTLDSGIPDDVLILAASWEERCLGAARRLKDYSCKKVIMSVYDGPSQLREKHIVELTYLLTPLGQLIKLPALHNNPLPNTRATIDEIKRVSGGRAPRITIDMTTFTRKHLLQLLQGLDMAGLLGNSRFLHTEPVDYDTHDNEAMAEGISEVKAIEAFSGWNTPSRDSILLIFLGYEGRRALALWEHLEPNITIAIVPDPPYRQEWKGRTEDQNRFLLSCLAKERVVFSDALDPAATTELLEKLIFDGDCHHSLFNYQVAPLGTKAQTLGLYRFWRRHPAMVTVMYASPTRYRQERATYPPGRTWCLDRSLNWTKLAPFPPSAYA